MKLAVFDLDQTLVEVMPVHDESTRRVFQEFFGVEARLTEVDFAGRSLKENFLRLGKLKMVPEARVRPRLDEMLACYDACFARLMPEDGARFVLPGALELLQALRDAGALLMLYTGDSRAVAEAICRSAGLTGYFAAAFYGTEAASRADMVKLAVERAGGLAGVDFRGKGVVIIGDSLRDIECGQELGALTIAVATGYHTAQQQRQAGADYVFPDLKDTQALLKAILG